MSVKNLLLNTYQARYVNRKIVLLTDVLVGAACMLLGSALYFYLDPSAGWSQFLHIKWILPALLFVGAVTTFVSSLIFSTYKQILRHSSFVVSYRLLAMALCNALLVIVAMALLFAIMGIPYSMRMLIFTAITFFVCFVLSISFVRFVMIWFARHLTRITVPENHINKQVVLIYGVNSAAEGIFQMLRNSREFQVVGFCTQESANNQFRLSDLKIYIIHNKSDLVKIVRQKHIQGIVFSNRYDFLAERESFIADCQSLGLSTYLCSQISATSVNEIARDSVRRIRIEDLLMRDVITHNHQSVRKVYQGKTVLVTGAAGSIGSELVKQIATYGVKQLVLLDNAESPLHEVRLYLNEYFPNLQFVPLIADVRQRNRIDVIFDHYKPQIVLHAAAYKHVPLMEENPCEAITVNAEGTRNIADACVAYNVDTMVMVSTDKAVNPTNVMGATKRAAEIYVQSLGKAIEEGKIKGKTTFITTRFGNVLGSQGSVIHLFREQIAKGGPVTVTHPDIVRFFMSIPEACSLVLQASSLGNRTEIFVFDMGEEHKIVDLARRMIRLAGFEPDKDIKITFTGLRPGEKIYEEVLATDESTVKTDLPKVRIALVRPADYTQILRPYEALCAKAREVKPMDAVTLLKAFVPEYKSTNSACAILDKHYDAGKGIPTRVAFETFSSHNPIEACETMPFNQVTTIDYKI